MAVQDLVWLLLPVAAASGWWAANRSARKREARGEHESNPVYFKGLNHLLNEEPDKAIDVFVEMLEVDSDTVETHLALGNLFRRRGEVDRAIRIHQNLIARPALSREQRAQALLELGQDYMRAGLFDRAENLFKELRQSKLHVSHALSNLRTIYQQEKDWEACLEIADAMEKASGQSQSLDKSHYYCELALKARQAAKPAEAERHLKRALGVERRCVRANHMMAQLAFDRGDTKEAIKLLRMTVEQDPEYLPEVIQEIVEGYRAQSDLRTLRQFLESVTTQYPSSGSQLQLAELIRQQEGDASAIEYLGQQLARLPSMPGLIRLVELQCQSPANDGNPLLNSVRSHLNSLMADNANYQCHQCGFQAKQLHWQCPSCRRWSTIKRKPLLEADSSSTH